MEPNTELISDKELAIFLGYANSRGGRRALRDFLKTRGVLPTDNRLPAMYDKNAALTAYETRPPKRGNFTTGADRQAQIDKARATRAANQTG